MTLADTIREFALSSYVQPVRKQNQFRRLLVTIVSRDIVNGMKLQARTPAVCGALDAQTFCTDNNLKLMT
jgi:hypothetical protein